MKVFSTSAEFNYSWEEVSIGNWQKYSQWNEKADHVLSVDTLSRTVDSSTGILRTERLIKCKQGAPKWVQPFLGGDDVSYVYETSYIDPQRQKLTMCSHNLTYSELIIVRETVQYHPCASSPDTKTIFSQRAEITALCGGWQKIKNKIEGALVERFSQNAANGREGFEMVLKKAREVFQEEREKRQQDQLQDQQPLHLMLNLDEMKMQPIPPELVMMQK